MILLGLYDGIALRFSDGLLSGLDMGRFGRSYDLHEEISTPVSPIGESIPYLPIESSLDMSDARFRGLDPYSGRQVHQTLAGGQRTISIQQSQALLGAPLTEAILARVNLEISLHSPAVWRLNAGEAVWQSDEAGVEAYLGKGCSVRVSATSRLAIEDQHTLSIELEAGASIVEMWIEAQPALPMAPAVIVCTQRQGREAAVVASAVGGGDRAYIPILDLDLPPMSIADVQSANARLSDLANQIAQIETQMENVAQQGAPAAGGIILPGAQSVEKSLQKLTQQRESMLDAIEPLQQQIVRYAAWTRRSALVARVVASMTTGSTESPLLLVLSPYPIDLMQAWATSADIVTLLPESASAESAEWQQALQGSIAAVRNEIVFWKDLQDLATQVWTRLHSGEQPVFFTIPDDPAFYPVGLIDAVRRGRALLPRGRAGANVNLDEIQEKLNAETGGDHAVIVEADGGISSLVGALYAHHMGAPLYVNSPRPRLDDAFDSMRRITEGIQREHLAALAANAYRYIGEHRKEFMQSQAGDPQLKQVAAGLSILELPATVPTPYSDAQFVQALTTYLTAQQAGAQQGYRYDDKQWSQDLASLEAQVTAAVSPSIRKAVLKTKRLTIFTAGLPYGLADGWDNKIIGLVVQDLAAPYTLQAVAQANAGRPAYTLALTLDPGIEQRPAPDVANLVDRTIALRGPAASAANLAVLGSLLPLDAVLLHTQGNLDSVILGDARNQLVEVQSSELGAQVRFPSAPLVIYSAPLAWLGLGLTLLEQGAGGFVGAMWPVDASGVEDAARIVLTGVMVKGQNPAEALRSLPSYEPRTSRAFVYLGTAAPQPAPRGDVLAEAPMLYAAAARLAASGRTAAATMVYDRLRALTGEQAAATPELRAEFLLLDADYQTRLSSRNRERPAQDVLDKLTQSLETLDKLGIDAVYKDALRIALRERAAVLELAGENFDRARDLIQSIRDARRQSGQLGAEASAAYLLAVVQERQQQFAAARQTLLDVQDQLSTLGNAVGLVMVSTSLAFVSLPLAMYPDVLGHLKMAVSASLALGSQVLSETLLQTLSVARVMAQAGAYVDLATTTRTLAGIIEADSRLSAADRSSIASVFTLMQNTADILLAELPAQEREAKLAALVEQAQGNDLARSLGLDAWILSAGSPQSGDTTA
jgi:hypothetical protein